jgi:hypothetical protein
MPFKTFLRQKSGLESDASSLLNTGSFLKKYVAAGGIIGITQ